MSRQPMDMSDALLIASVSVYRDLEQLSHREHQLRVLLSQLLSALPDYLMARYLQETQELAQAEAEACPVCRQTACDEEVRA